MVSLRRLSLLVLCALAGCGYPRGVCDGIFCEGNRICDPQTGACVANPNPKDAGFIDAGVTDAGTDAGAPDAGVMDAGRACPPGCADAGQLCDTFSGTCVNCLTNAGCSDAGQLCDTRSGTCVDCLTNAGCADAGQVCDTFSGTCVDCLTNAECSCPRPQCDVARHSCVVDLPDAGPFVQPIGESCADATPIVFPTCSPTRTTFRVDLGRLADDVQGTCSAASGLGRDGVFILNVPTTSDVRVSTARAPGSTAQAVTYLRVSPCLSGAELVCHESYGSPTNFRAKSLAPGNYALVVDAYGQTSSGPVDVTVELLPPVTNDTCAAPLDAPTDGGSLVVDLSGAVDDLTGSCNSKADSRDAVYRLTVTERSELGALVEDSSGLRADPVLYLRATNCADAGAELACVDTGVDNDPERLVVRPVAPGTYYLVVEGWGAAGSQAVKLTTWANALPRPPNDTCAAPRKLDFQSTSSISIPIDTSEAEDDYEGSCALGGRGREVVLYFTLAAPRTVTVTAASADGGYAVDPVIYLREGACELDAGTLDAGRELGCDDATSGPEYLSRSLGPGTYFLFVDSYSPATAGPTIVTVSLSP